MEHVTYTSFAGERLIFSGEVKEMLLRTKQRLDAGESEPVLIFEDATGKQIDFDFRGTAEEVVARLASHPHFAAAEEAPAARSGPGRPNLGVVSREVTLLPRHWEWLGRQRGGISAAIRRLVDEERKRNPGQEKAQAAIDAAAKFMWVMAGNRPWFEEASRALYAEDYARFETLIREWPADIRQHLLDLLREPADRKAAG
jgi:hypothetical protein